jgi:DeoR family suf operon transcriptional repressor
VDQHGSVPGGHDLHPPVTLGLVSSRQQLLLLLRKHPGVTVADLARDLGITGVGVRRHLAALAAEGLVEQSRCAQPGPGRPPAGWRLSASGRELFPRRYDTLALELLEELPPEEVAGALGRRNDKQVTHYRAVTATCGSLGEQVAELARLRDAAGYQADSAGTEDGSFVLTEHNCAIHRVAERHPAVCSLELSLLRRVLGPDVEVTRRAHAMAGDAVCAYCIRPRTAD